MNYKLKKYHNCDSLFRYTIYHTLDTHQLPIDTRLAREKEKDANFVNIKVDLNTLKTTYIKASGDDNMYQDRKV